MVRFEKIAYEQLLNNKTLGRARKITTPQKWFKHNIVDYRQVQAGYQEENSLTSKLLSSIAYPFYKRFWWEWQRDHALQRGFTMDDFEVYSERELRRSPFMENVWRDSCHPYQWLLYKYRRMRYYKVERGIQGFFMPEHVVPFNKLNVITYFKNVDFRKK